TPLMEGAEVAFGLVKLRFSAAPDADPDSARASYVPPTESPRLAERTAFRMPVWLVALILLIIVLLVAMYFVFSGDPQAVSEPVAALSLPRTPPAPDRLAA